MHDGRAELGDVKEAKGPLAIEIEDAQIIGFTQIAHNHTEMIAISLLGSRDRHFVGDELVDAFGRELIQQSWFGEGGVGSQNNQGPTTGEQQGSFHDALLNDMEIEMVI
jgi:hypothetical protein